MTIEHVNNGFTDGVKKVFESIGNGVKWLGYHIKVGFLKLVDLIKTCWNKAAPVIGKGFEKFWYALRTGPGLCILGVTTALGIGIGAVHVKNQWARFAMIIGSIATAALGGIAFGLGISNGMTNTLF